MAAFVQDTLLQADFAPTYSLKVALCTVSPSGIHLYSGLTQLIAANGYTTGGKAFPNVFLTTGNNFYTWSGDAIVWTASGGTMGDPSAGFRYAVLYDVTSGNVLGYWDLGAVIALQTGKTFTLKPSGLATNGIILGIL